MNIKIQSQQLSRMVKDVDPKFAPDLVRMLRGAANEVFRSLHARGFWLSATGEATYIPDMETRSLETRFAWIVYKTLTDRDADTPQEIKLLREPAYRWLYWTLANRFGQSHAIWTKNLGRIHLRQFPEPPKLDEHDIYLDDVPNFSPGAWDFDIEIEEETE